MYKANGLQFTSPRYWRDLDLEAWKQAEGGEWLKRHMEYPGISASAG